MFSSIYQLRIAAVVAASPWLAAPCVGLQLSDAMWKDQAKPVDFDVKVVREMEHVGKPWTQGLEFTEEGDALIETSGSFPPGTPSFVRMLDAKTGKELSRTTAGFDKGAEGGHGRFAEGVTQLGSGPDAHWFASTYTDHVVVMYDQDFKELAEQPYPFEGWGLVRNADSTGFIATNGSQHVMDLDPQSLEVRSVKTARCHGKDVPDINELEMVENFMGRGPALLGNIMGTRLVIALDPSSMHCIGAFHLDSLGNVQEGEKYGLHVANGIAFNRQTGNFIVTGKNWDKMYEISLDDSSLPDDSDDSDGSDDLGALALLATHLGVDAGRGTGSGTPQLPHAVRNKRHHSLRASNP